MNIHYMIYSLLAYASLSNIFCMFVLLVYDLLVMKAQLKLALSFECFVFVLITGLWHRLLV